VRNGSATERQDLGQFDARKNRRARRIIWLVATVVVVIVTVLITSTPDKTPGTPSEHLLSLIPTYLVGFETIRKDDIELITLPDSTNGAPIQYAIAYYEARERFSDLLLGIELRVDRYASSALAENREGGPYIADSWGFEGLEIEWRVGGSTRELPSSPGEVAVDVCTWEGLYGPFQGARFYTWTRESFRLQLTLVGDPVYIFTEEGVSHIVFAWEKVAEQWRPTQSGG